MGSPTDSPIAAAAAQAFTQIVNENIKAKGLDVDDGVKMKADPMHPMAMALSASGVDLNSLRNIGITAVLNAVNNTQVDSPLENKDMKRDNGKASGIV